MSRGFDKYRLLAVIAGAVVLADQATKAWIESVMDLHESIPVVSNLFNLTLIRNLGAAFGFLSETGGSLRTVFFIAVSFIAIAVLAYLYRQAPPDSLVLRSALSMVTGGAIGNLVDRLRYGEVVDFLDFYIGSHHWPAFNVADSCISVGITLLLLQTFLGRRAEGDVPSSS